jgi:regulator of sigma D
MAPIKYFEDLDRKKAREVCKLLGDMIDQGRFKKNYRLIHQIEGSSGSIMDNIVEGFERGTKLELFNFSGIQKDHAGSYDLNYIEPWTETILLK